MSSGYDDLRAVPLTARPGRGRRWLCEEDPDLWFSERPRRLNHAWG